jgi:hypothetical protein
MKVPFKWYEIAEKMLNRAYNKIVKNEFITVEDIPNINDGKLRYEDISVV